MLCNGARKISLQAIRFFGLLILLLVISCLTPGGAYATVPSGYFEDDYIKLLDFLEYSDDVQKTERK